MVTVSVPGKIHFMGEHAVVYGKPALLAAINLRMQVSIESGSGEIVSTEPIEHAQFALDYLADVLHIPKTDNIKLTITSDIPAGFHLGSSAALAVGITGAVMYYYKKIWNPIRINELAYEIEKKQHGNPSGGDNTVVTMGGFIWFRKELEFLKSIWQLPFKPHASLNHFFLINTGKPKETTGEMVEYVRTKLEIRNSKLETIFNINERQTKRIAAALKEGNEDELIDAIRTGEKTLEGMGVVSKKVQPLLRQIEKAGGAVKILGGGGKQEGVGFLLCYHHNTNKIQRLCAPFGFTLQQISLGEEGVRLDEKE